MCVRGVQVCACVHGESLAGCTLSIKQWSSGRQNFMFSLSLCVSLSEIAVCWLCDNNDKTLAWCVMVTFRPGREGARRVPLVVGDSGVWAHSCGSVDTDGAQLELSFRPENKRIQYNKFVPIYICNYFSPSPPFSVYPVSIFSLCFTIIFILVRAMNIEGLSKPTGA